MRILFLILFLLFFFFSSTSYSTADVIQQACKATRFPEKCKAQSAHFTSQPSPLQIIQSAISISRQNLQSAQSKLRRILATSTGNRNVTQAAETCLEVLGYSDIRSAAAKIALSRARVKNARAFLTAALAYQYDCWGGLKYVSDTVAIRETMSFLNDTVIISTSNALSMVVAFDVIGPELGSWSPPRTERDGFWETRSGSNSSLRKWSFGSASGLKPNVTVCKEGCDYTTVQKAVEAAPANLVGTRRFVIHIKEGVYEEIVRIGFEKKNLVFLGDGIGKTMITGSLNTGLQGITTYKTATVGVLGDGFMARGLTIQNTAGANAHQAVAFRSDSDLSLIENCEFLGNQDTLYVHSLRQYFKSCQIQGNVDFIMGNAAVIFENCTLLIRPRQESPGNSETNCIAAHGRTDPAESTGFVFLNCFINGTDEYMKLFHTNPAVHNNYLGRPWKEFSRIVFIDCLLEKLINPVGWLHWDGDFALKTLYFGEFGNKGLGANLSKRVSWSSLIPAQHVDAYSLQNFLLG